MGIYWYGIWDYDLVKLVVEPKAILARSLEDARDRAARQIPEDYAEAFEEGRLRIEVRKF